MQILALIATGAAVLVSIPAVQGHGYIVDPAAQWTQGYPSNGYGSTIDSGIWGAIDNSKYGYGPSGAINFIKANLPTKGGGSLGAFIAKNQKLYSSEVDPNCGLTAYKDSARSKLPSQLEYTGFTHPGPCEVWCDDTKVLFDYDCQTKFAGSPAKMAYDESKCANANRLTIYWIAVHGDPWQVYTDCVWLKGGSGEGSPPSAVGNGASTVADGSASNTTTTETSPSSGTTTAAPSTSSTTTAPSSPTTSGSEETGNEASSSVSSSTDDANTLASGSIDAITVTASPSTTTSDTPSTPATEAPSAPSSGTKCARRRH
ncbi:sarcosine oxidase [Phytophthora cinnamomi]|uniref:sarcosine oxidase n=1 Tax=Phytophthora cinnamomi TaxID=4785 RepID=UPI00355A745F|nr:sarcosine oxidase [Phytophthora cinnamomi]